MLKNFYKKLIKEYKSYSKYEKFFIFFIFICCFSISSEAAITRAIANSVFLSAYTAKSFPHVWLASVPINFVIVVIYNKFLSSFGCAKTFCAIITAAIVINTFSVFHLESSKILPFLLYIWKDIFIILLFQQLWSVINATISRSRAKYLYGIFFGIGGCGSVAGSMIPGFLAILIGSEKLLLTTIPFYLITTICYCLSLHVREKIESRQNISTMINGSKGVFEGINLIRNSKFLLFILIIVVGMQITSTILDYQFCSYVEQVFSDQDIRTQFLGRFFGFVNIINIFLQFLGSFLLLQLIGLYSSHFLIPCVLGINSLLSLIFPTFRMVCFSFGSIKALDYSIFGIIKEMLYIPLKVDEKFKAKAIIDVFAYRSSKACASIIVLLLQYITFINLDLMLSYGLLVIFIIWIFAVTFMFKHYNKEVDRQHINWPELQKAEF